EGAMGLLKKLPGYRTAEPGWERIILRRLAPALAIGLALIMTPSVLLRVLPWAMHALKISELISKSDIYAIAAMWVFFNVLVFVAFYCIIIMLMKGPAYVADAYPLSDAERLRPLPDQER